MATAVGLENAAHSLLRHAQMATKSAVEILVWVGSVPTAFGVIPIMFSTVTESSSPIKQCRCVSFGKNCILPVASILIDIVANKLATEQCC